MLYDRIGILLTQIHAVAMQIVIRFITKNIVMGSAKAVSTANEFTVIDCQCPLSDALQKCELDSFESRVAVKSFSTKKLYPQGHENTSWTQRSERELKKFEFKCVPSDAQIESTCSENIHNYMILLYLLQCFRH